MFAGDLTTNLTSDLTSHACEAATAQSDSVGAFGSVTRLWSTQHVGQTSTQT